MATETGEPDLLTVDELAARAGVTVRTIRFYSTRGLLPPPELGPRRVGHYGPGHLSRLALIEELQHQGLTLAAIERYLRRLPDDLSAHDLAIHRAVVASWVPDCTAEITHAELERRAGRPLAEDDIAKLAAMDVLERRPGVGESGEAGEAAGEPGEAAEEPGASSSSEEDRFRVDPGLLALGTQLLAVPAPLSAVLAARTVLLDHARATAEALTRLFHEEVWGPYEARETDPAEVEAMKSLSAHMQPLVVQALVTAFQRALREELRRTYGTGGDGNSGGDGGGG
ncbi:MerR family transcriptional regulator [Streptomyces huiliensis]|uniref:MerR family transcriptional regulator n=1 Tax=Streptomyces huiliensis TaxID=2876027 RepID=UPI001CC01B58|nr:MerR family transcriptional regulator [Streptomyces huiliensis]MBZ4319981.1 MerR family transcriptional regulator [Streptomyces huiliensis]